MKKLELSPRLAAIGARVPKGARLADVGTDHAYLPAALLLAGHLAGAVATDINEGPLQRGRETARTYGVAEQITFCRTDGLNGVTADQADTVVIAGMGGELIAHILDQAPWTKDALLLLQPMTSQPQLRQWLEEHGYGIREETIVREGEKFYLIFTVRGGAPERPSTPAELWAGRQDPDQEHRLDYISDLLRRRRRALEGMKQGSRDPDAIARETALVEALEAMREECQAWQR